MSQINNISENLVSQTSQIQKLAANPIQKQIPADAPPVRASDRLELSGAGAYLAMAKANDVRVDKVQSIREQIQNGTFDADGSKLDAASDKLLDELNEG